MVTSLSNSFGSALGSVTGKATNDEVTQEDFLNLLIAQLQNQDPLNPTENQEFVAELATFSSLEQQQIQTQLMQQMLAAGQTSQDSQALSLIGREVVAEGSQFQYSPGNEMEFVFQAAKTGNAFVTFYNESGNPVHFESVPVAAAGAQTYRFGGTTSNGTQLPSGNYQISIASGVDAQGDQTPYATYIQGVVDGVSFMNGQAMLSVNGQGVPLSAVQTVSERRD